MSNAYKVDERVLKRIVYQNTTCTDPDNKLRLIIYYKNLKTKNLVMRNNLNPNSEMKSTNVVYQYTCPDGDCMLRPNVSYVGYTTTTLSRRLTMHLDKSAMKIHEERLHNTTLTRDKLVKNTQIIARPKDVNRLELTEAIIIKCTDPEINKQDTGKCRVLKLFSEDNSTSRPVIAAGTTADIAEDRPPPVRRTDTGRRHIRGRHAHQSANAEP